MKKCEINKKLLPMKIHYFCFGAGLSGVMPFMPVLAKQLGISATGVGIVLTVALFLGVVAKPLFGALADHFKKLKCIMAFSALFMMAMFYGISFIPAAVSSTNGRHFNLSSCSVSQMLTHPSSDVVNCTAQCGNDTSIAIGIAPNNNWTDNCVVNDTLCVVECPSDCHSGPSSIYLTYRFLVFFFLYAGAYTLLSVVTSLSDAACYELLEGNSQIYGRQRLWGTIGWGFFSLVNGYLITSVSAGSDSSIVNYSPGFYIMLVIIMLDIVNIGLADMRSSERSTSILRDVGRLLVDVKILLFLLSVFCVGVLTALQWTFLFIYLKELGANSLLLGLSLTVQCFLGELPTFVVSGLVVHKIGHICSISVAIAAFAVRFLWYSFITDAWYVLPVEVMHGATFGIFYTAMTSYAKLVAPAGTEATMQGLVGATFECLGLAVGNLIGGVAFDSYGGRSTYRTAGIIAVACCLINLVPYLHAVWTKRHPIKETETVEDELPHQEEKETFITTDDSYTRAQE